MIRQRARSPLLLAALLLLALSPVRVAHGQADLADSHPLRPPDTSSPRDTLRSFLTNITQALYFREQALQFPDVRPPAKEGLRARKRAIETLNLESTPHGDSPYVQDERVLLLKEILDRIELPPWEEIPGDREVADQAITRWTIPNTRIAIARVESGRRAGEFLFSARSVERLDRNYRHVKDLPYKPGTKGGAYEAYLRSDRTQRVFSQAVRNRLKPVDTSSPRSTLEGFLDSVNRAHALVMEADAALRAKPPTLTREQALELEEKADGFLARAVGALDLSQVPEAIRKDAGLEATLQLKEILDRVPLPPLDSVPGASRVRAWTEQPAGRPLRWRIPDTPLEIVQISEGDRADEFLFSAATVGRLAADYERLRDLPYRTTAFSGESPDYLSPGTSEGFYEFYRSTAGHLVPRASLLGRVIERLPDSLRAPYLGQTRWQWIGTLLLCGLLLPLAALAVFRLVRRLARAVQHPWDEWLPILTPTLVAVLVLSVLRFVDEDLNVTGQALALLTTGARLVVLTMAVWGAYRLCRAVAESVIASPRVFRVADRSLDASLIRIAARVVAFLIGAWIVVAGIRGLGVDVVPLLAGLGVGGLAVALAAQTTFANFIGSLILYANKPVRRGDFCAYGDKIGTVEEIGLHSTRIRSLERTLVTVPNADFSQMQLENISVRDRRLFRTTLHLRYETTPEQLRYVLARTRELLIGHPKVLPDPGRVRFEGYGPGSKSLGIFAYLDCQSQNDFLAIQEDLLLRIEDIVSEAGTAFAIPAQTSYLAQAPAVDTARREEAEALVGQWRDEDRLPFPEFAGEQRRQLTDVLDYPPEGSPDHRPRPDPSGEEPEPRPADRARAPWTRLLRRRQES